MDTSKHVVTIPIADYEKLKQGNAIGENITKSIQRHIDLLKEAGIEIKYLNPAIMPTRIATTAGRTQRGDAVQVDFQY